MQIKNLFLNDINRNINGVITVGDDNEKAVETEIHEYVVTKELRPHFTKFFSRFASALDTPSNAIGVWISGFFGSGKSHFLKMLSYLLENKTVCGKTTVEYFRDKFDDPLDFQEGIERCCAKGNNKTLLFNIGDYQGEKSTAIRDVFSQHFYNMLGYHGDDWKVVEFEKWVDGTGRLQDFIDCYEGPQGRKWAEDGGNFRKKPVIDALVKAGVCDEEEALVVYKKYSGDMSKIFSIDTLTNDIADYVNKQPDDFRLIFMVDEVGAFIGESSQSMLDLQSFVECLGTKCKGKVWVVVTGQEAIDKVISVKGDQFNKILDRFATKLHLTADSVEEVIRKRLLQKKPECVDTLTVIYEQKSAALKNTFTFESASSGLKGYRDADEFVADYPFVSYQFRLLQTALDGARSHKHSTFTLSSGSRNMLGAFKFGIANGTIVVNGTPIAIQNAELGGNGDGALFPFYRFYDAISESLITGIRKIFSNAQNQADKGEGLKQEDVNVLKVLYLIRYAEGDLKSTLNNIAILMTQSIDEDQIALRKKVGESLERLRSENFAAKAGDYWQFLTDEERDVDVEIQQTSISSDEISKEIGEIIFSQIFPAKKLKYNDYDFDFSRYVDDLTIGSAVGGLRISVVTPGNVMGKGDDITHVLQSKKDGSVIAILSDEFPFYEKIREILQIEKYSRTKNQASLQAGVKIAISARVSQAKIDRGAVLAAIEKSLKGATFYIDGAKHIVSGLSAKEKVQHALEELVHAIYTDLKDITYNIKNESEIRNILNRDESAELSTAIVNPVAVEGLGVFLAAKYASHVNVSVSEIYKRYREKPFGYREYDIAAMIAELLVAQKVVLSYNGKEYKKSDSMALDLILKKAYTDSTLVKQRISIDPALLAKCINIMKDFADDMAVPTKEDSFFEYSKIIFQKRKDACDQFLSDYYSHGYYPKKAAIEQAREVYNDLLLYKNNELSFFQRIREREDDLLNAKQDTEDTVSFFGGKQKQLFDAAVKKIEFVHDDEEYVLAKPEAKSAYESIKAILAMEEPFSKIFELPTLVASLELQHTQLLTQEKDRAKKIIEEGKTKLAGYVQEFEESKALYREILSLLASQATFVSGAQKIVGVVAQQPKIKDIIETGIANLLNVKPRVVGDNPPAPKEPVHVKKSSVISPAVLKSKTDVDSFISELRDKLYAYLKDGGVSIDD